MNDQEYQEFCDFLDPQVFIVHDMLMVDKENYKLYFKKFYNYMKQGFEEEKVRKHMVKYKFTSDPKEPVREMEIRHLIINMIFWRPFIKMDRVEELNPVHIADCSNMTTAYVKNYIDTLIIDPYRKLYSNKKLNHIVESLIYQLSKISLDFNTIMAMSINIESFLDVAEHNPRFNQIIRTKLKPGMQPKDIETLQHNLMVEGIDILKNTPNCLQPMLRAGAGIKDKQLSEFAFIGGLKPDVNGNTIPIPNNSNFLVGGLNNLPNYYVDAQAGRKSVILNKTSINYSACA
jgi:hypothetical protein